MSSCSSLTRHPSWSWSSSSAGGIDHFRLAAMTSMSWSRNVPVGVEKHAVHGSSAANWEYCSSLVDTEERGVGVGDS